MLFAAAPVQAQYRNAEFDEVANIKMKDLTPAEHLMRARNAGLYSLGAVLAGTATSILVVRESPEFSNFILGATAATFVYCQWRFYINLGKAGKKLRKEK